MGISSLHRLRVFEEKHEDDDAGDEWKPFGMKWNKIVIRSEWEKGNHVIGFHNVKMRNENSRNKNVESKKKIKCTLEGFIWIKKNFIKNVKALTYVLSYLIF